MENNRLYSFIGLIQKAGKLSSGDAGVEINTKKGKCSLIILAEDASDNIKNKFINLAEQYNVPYVYFGTKENLGQCIGKSDRAVLAVADENFAKSFLDRIQNQ